MSIDRTILRSYYDQMEVRLWWLKIVDDYCNGVTYLYEFSSVTSCSFYGHLVLFREILRLGKVKLKLA